MWRDYTKALGCLRHNRWDALAWQSLLAQGAMEKEVEQLFGEQIADRRMLAQYPRAKNLGS